MLVDVTYVASRPIKTIQEGQYNPKFHSVVSHVTCIGINGNRCNNGIIKSGLFNTVKPERLKKQKVISD